MLTVSTVGGSGGLERTDFNNFYFGEEVVVSERPNFNNFYFGDEVMVSKELILTISTLGRKWWS